LLPGQSLLKEAQDIKAEANQLFSAGCYDQAISCYDRALASCPNYLDYDIAVIRSNIAATYLKLEDWKSAVDSATMAIERLDKVIPPTTENKDQGDTKEVVQSGAETQASDAVIELSGDDEEDEEKELQRLKELDEQRTNVLRIRAKALMRRAKARSEIGGWASLQGAAEDYQALAAMENLPAGDRRIVQRALLELPDRIKEAREKEMGEMMSKLKGVGGPPQLY
jgi:tetratricopeptide (TPR) repeat protein